MLKTQLHKPQDIVMVYVIMDNGLNTLNVICIIRTLTKTFNADLSFYESRFSFSVN